MEKKSTFNDSKDPLHVCFRKDRGVGSLGVFVGDNPFQFLLPVTLCQLIAILVASRVVFHVLRPLKTPKFICSLTAGILLGPSFLGKNKRFLEIFYPTMQLSVILAIGRLGIVYFIFSVTLKMDILATLRGVKRCWIFGVIPFLSAYLVMTTVLDIYKPIGDLDTTKSIFVFPHIITLSSVPVISQVLQELNLVTTELGQISLSSIMVAEIMQWTAISFQHDFSKNNGNSGLFLIKIFGGVLCGIFIIRPTMKMITRRIPVGQQLNEIYVVMILLGALLSAGLAQALGLTFIFGPTIYGLVIPNGPPLASTILDKSETIISEFLMPFFFAYFGLNTDLTKIHNWKLSIVFQCILMVGILVKVIACVLLAPTYNISPNHGMALGLIFSIKGMSELLFFSALKKSRAIKDPIFSQLVLYVVLATSICALFINVLYKHHSRVLKSPTIVKGRVRTLHNTPENLEFNIISCVHNDGNVHSMIALLDALHPRIESPICVHVIHLIELSGQFTPILLPMNKKNKKSLSINYPNTNAICRAFENYSNNSSGPVTILSYINVAPYNSMHKAVCNLAEDNSVPFLIIPFHENDQSLGNHTHAFIRELNINFLASARCTVGVLVDRYLRLGLSISKLYFHVGIFFIGGIDDREALSLGIRMLERMNMRVTLLRFVMNNSNTSQIDKDLMLKENKEEKELERMMDESLVDEFKGKKYNNDNVVFHEFVVEDCIQLLELIRGIIEKDYDLVMVGKRHNLGDLTDEEMSNFMDNTEQLGIVGDMLVSTEFCNGIIPVLVLQCAEKC
ncbi:hypothetical protein RIF29_08970 [Crotalaria pallida]|uniref:Cation/H+ exchanger domain-containing protein n=1 Tax=Crotalaria pallida TaxID=3830 RepID=A0AAN9IHM6_CROPI